MSDTVMQLRNIARVLRKGFAGHLAFDSVECQGMAESLAIAANELESAERILAALREPSEAVVMMTLKRTGANAIRAAVGAAEIFAAVAAAERDEEVGRE